MPTLSIILMACAGLLAAPEESALQQLKYNHPGLVVDLGVGLWAHPLPMDYDGDGDHDLVVVTHDVPSNGTYFFENVEGDVPFPTFKAGVRIGEGERDVTLSRTGGRWEVLTRGQRHPRFRETAFAEPQAIPYEPTFLPKRARAQQWSLGDYDGDGLTDLIIGVSDWEDYGWDNAFDAQGEWTRGPLHGYVYVMRNRGTEEAPAYGPARQLMVGDQPLDVYGCPSPNFADWDGDGDLDLICGEFLDRMTYFENVGLRSDPRYAEGRFLMHEGRPITMDLEMIRVVAFDWDKDGDVDLVVGQEDGRVALVKNVGLEEGIPIFRPPLFFRQEADSVKIGALCTPFAVDWDGDGDEDLLAGDTAGYINFVENLDGGDPPKWAAPMYLQAGRETIRIQAGPNGSIQGPAEAKWGYTVLNAADWDHDGLVDIMINSIWGEVLWFRNAGTARAPELEAARPVEVDWEGPTPKPAWFWWEPKGKQLVTQWRTSPVIIDWNEDGLNDLVMLDQEGYPAWFERVRAADGLHLKPGKRIFLDEELQPLRFNEREAGSSGRRKIAIADWDGDGRRDILLNGRNIDFMRNEADSVNGTVFTMQGEVDPRRLAGHTTCPTLVHWGGRRLPDLLIGAEDGFLYLLRNPHEAAQ